MDLDLWGVNGTGIELCVRIQGPCKEVQREVVNLICNSALLEAICSLETFSFSLIPSSSCPGPHNLPPYLLVFMWLSWGVATGYW